MWHDDFDSDDDDDDDELNEWYNGYKRCQGQESRNKRSVNAHCLASIKMMGSAYVRGGEKKVRKYSLVSFK